MIPTGIEAMKIGAIIYFVPFFFVMNPAMVLQGSNPYLEALGLTVLIAIGTLFICGGIQGYQAGIGDLRRAGFMQWPLRVLLILGGIVLATPGGGIMPLSEMQNMVGFGLALLVPAVLVALLLVRRGPAIEHRRRAMS